MISIKEYTFFPSLLGYITHGTHCFLEKVMIQKNIPILSNLRFSLFPSCLISMGT